MVLYYFLKISSKRITHLFYFLTKEWIVNQKNLHDCTSLLEIHFEEPSSLDIIGERAFFNCESLNELIIPSSVTLIDKMAFMHCESLYKVYSPPSVKLYDWYAFMCCAGIEDLKIYEGTSVNEAAFKGAL